MTATTIRCFRLAGRRPFVVEEKWGVLPRILDRIEFTHGDVSGVWVESIVVASMRSALRSSHETELLVCRMPAAAFGAWIDAHFLAGVYGTSVRIRLQRAPNLGRLRLVVRVRGSRRFVTRIARVHGTSRRARVQLEITTHPGGGGGCHV